MKRFYGSAVFEGEEVADSALTQLQNIRGEETRRVYAAEYEFKMQYDELVFWRADELATIDTDTYNRINELNRLIAQYHREIAQIRVDFRADAASLIAELNRAIRDIAQIHSDRSRLIATVHADFAIEYNIRITRMDKDIAWSHSEATDKIAAVLARRYYVPVFMMRCAKGPCEFCRAKYGTTGTRDELDTLKCIPPFHDDCRCWLEELGYVVMTH